MFKGLSTTVAENGELVAGIGNFVAVSSDFVAVFYDYSFGDKVAVSGNKVAGFGNRCGQDFKYSSRELRCLSLLVSNRNTTNPALRQSHDIFTSSDTEL